MTTTRLLVYYHNVQAEREAKRKEKEERKALRQQQRLEKKQRKAKEKATEKAIKEVGINKHTPGLTFLYRNFKTRPFTDFLDCLFARI